MRSGSLCPGKALNRTPTATEAGTFRRSVRASQYIDNAARGTR